jgi:uncharacterized membrane protein YfcA
MSTASILIIMAGALLGGIVNGLTGFGTGITAMGIWLYAVSPTVAASLAVVTAAFAQFQTLHLVWHAIRWERVLPFIIPGLLGVPLGAYILTHIDPRLFKLCLGCFLMVYPIYSVMRDRPTETAWGGRFADGIIGFGGGVLGGLTGLSGVLPVVWTDIRGWIKEQRRSVVQAFNIAILTVALAVHALSGLLTKDFMVAALVALPATFCGAWTGSYLYRRLGDRGYRRVVMALLFVSGAGLVWSSF